MSKLKDLWTGATGPRVGKTPLLQVIVGAIVTIIILRIVMSLLSGSSKQRIIQDGRTDRRTITVAGRTDRAAIAADRRIYIAQERTYRQAQRQGTLLSILRMHPLVRR